MDINKFKIDLDKEKDGVWLPIFDGTVEVKVRPLTCPDYIHMEMRLLSQVPEEQRPDGNYAIAAIAGLQAQCIAETILLDWKGLTEGGKPLPYSREAADRLLTDDSFRVFRNQIVGAATRATAVVVGTIEADEKNLLRPSGGTSTGGTKSTGSKRSRAKAR